MATSDFVKRETTGAFALIDSLVRHGVKHVFGYPGGAILPVYDELYAWEKEGFIEHILVRHEQGAAHASDAYSRSTGKVGVCLATSGPGATNLVTGIATAHMDSIPILVITGQVGRSFIGTDAFQEIDIFGITLPIVKHSYVVRKTEDMSRIVAAAFFICKYKRPGPVLIDIPKDVGLEQFEYTPVEPGNVNLLGCPVIKNEYKNRIEQAANLILQSNQPLLYVGGGAITSNAHEEISQLSQYLQLPVATTLMGKGIISETSILSLGMLGMHGTVYANYAVSECDLLIALGARFDDRVTGKLDEFACHAQIIHVDIDPAEVGKNRVPQVGIVGEVKEVVQELLKVLRSLGKPAYDQTAPWRKRLSRWRSEYPLLVPRNTKNLSPQEVISEINLRCLDAYWTTDVGQHQMWAAQFIKTSQKKWITSAGLGTMGYGLPAAIGTQIAHPNSQVICISGDASFQMNMQELGTVAQYGLPIKIVIINNKWQGMVRQWQQAFYGERYSHSNMEKGAPNFIRLGESFGIRGILIKTREELEKSVNDFIEYDGPVIMDVHVTPDTNCYPMVAPGKSNSQMLGI
jgi:acetolactate synthase I/II/III large subunit|uniref:acetohydroxyacid synthetase large subunit n=1 Tax=Cryptomonas gyropyrenoidosa TaxID=233257 RepID=UPI0027AB2B38|nr:acetohydroxyacid synthetase large subunit [Cryptomonas gyropyrenoidosa]WFQ83039.1 acetohydroxyacid synthetase large subunit [Cryptomonas gyropyrenoidosa]